MTPNTRATSAGRAYLDLQNRARKEQRGTQEYLTAYVIERWLARLSRSPYADEFILKGGVLLAALGQRRPTADVDTLVLRLANDAQAVAARVVEIAAILDPDDGVEYLLETVGARVIRDHALYHGIRVTMDARIASAVLKFSLDVNFGDPVTPAPQAITFPGLRPESDPIRLLGYPVATVLAEKVATAIELGETNTRVRDFADIYTLTGSHSIRYAEMQEALLATASFRGITVVPLSSALGGLAAVRDRTYGAYRDSLGRFGSGLPENFAVLLGAVTTFADPLAGATSDFVWRPDQRAWSRAADGLAVNR